MGMRRWIAPAAGVLLVVVGIVVGATAPGREASFGWFAYAPLSGSTFSPGGIVVVTPALGLAAALVVLGLLVLAFCAGGAVARRRTLRTSGT
ncbi:hypothetical protein HQQ82_08600 [Rathayibacter sp. VKM Ac-2856]|uniref:hypothetical protein n=1 Tax=unclassified Rathayibacter TaxID=2609250 RepID=UPI0015665F5D|nr:MULTISPECIES: hypothetical protein [unclassified Rathayibacter]NQX04860.1 hypothetical protein [Rathayibacter sp. VKM Ac-2858]NQX20028.1 hypothetical protein [Rathayibacter sp. VKM Ac-2856]